MIEDYFTITWVTSGKVWLEGLADGRELGPIEVPADRCTAGWTISSAVGRGAKV